MRQADREGFQPRSAEVMAASVRRMARAVRRRQQSRLKGRAVVVRPPGWASQLETGLALLGVRVTVRLTEQASAARAALDRATDAARRCGPRHTAARRAQLSLGPTDAAKLRALEPRLLALLSKDAGQAASFVFDPCAALARMPDGPDAPLLARLRRLIDGAGAEVVPRPAVPISRIRVEFEERRTVHPPKPASGGSRSDA